MALILAHRGSSVEAPENTFESIKRAIDLGVDYVEIDIHFTKDHIPIVIHDPTFFRTTNYRGEKRVEETYLAELKHFDAGSWFDPRFSKERLPTLAEVFGLDFKSSGLMIEIKKDTLSARVLAQTIIDVIGNASKHRSLPFHCFGSFDPDIIREINRLSPKSKTVGIIEDLNLLVDFTRLEVDTLALWYELVDQELIMALKSQKFEIWAFTVDDLIASKRLLDMGVEGIITNVPHLFHGNLDNKKAR